MDRIKLAIQRGDKESVEEVGYFYTSWLESELKIIHDAKVIKITDQNGKVVWEIKGE